VPAALCSVQEAEERSAPLSWSSLPGESCVRPMGSASTMSCSRSHPGSVGGPESAAGGISLTLYFEAIKEMAS
jgi:hypothetical protein